MGNTLLTQGNMLVREEYKNKELNEENNKLKKRIKYLENKLNVKEYSKEEVDSFLKSYVKDILKDDKVNFDIIPDNVEEKIYVNCLKLFLGMITNGLKNSEIKFLNHSLKLNLEPDINN